MDYRLIFTLAVFFSLLTGCSGAGPGGSSNLEHTFGGTTYEKVVPPSCMKMEKEYPPEKYPQELVYIKKIAKHLMSSNSQIFKGDYSFGNFCFLF